MTKVELAEGRLLNEIHEHASLGIMMALEELISAVEEHGEAKGHAEGVAEGAEKERERLRREVSVPIHITASGEFTHADFSMWSKSLVPEGQYYAFPASVLAPPQRSVSHETCAERWYRVCC